jgi:NAD(P)-dependent dehydrogenase (short-subunit alcohol dehydrogenase family)
MSTRNVDMKGKICLVTGATSGIGRITARELARMGATVVVVARDPRRGDETVGAIRAETGNPAIELMIADLSSLASIRQLGREFKVRHDKLHVLVNNAGAVNATRRTTVDGMELTFATNHLGYFLLTHLVLDRLKASAPSRVVSVSSTAHKGKAMTWDDLQHEQRYAPVQVYGESKLANILFTYELARRLDGTGVTANCLHPGVIASGFAQNDPGWIRFGFKLLRPFILTPEQGARTSIYLASSPEVEKVSGKYFVRSTAVRSSRASYSVADARRLWEVSEELVRLAPEERLAAA